MAAEHASLGSDVDAAAAMDTAEKVTEESLGSAVAGAVFERDHVKDNPAEEDPPDKK